MYERHAIRRGRCAFLEQRRHHRHRPVVARRVVPFHQQLVAFGVVQHVQILDAALGVGHDGLHQPGEMRRHARHRRRLEQIGVVADAAVQASGVLRERERQVELGLYALAAHGLQGQPRQRERVHRRVLQRQHYLEQRRMAGVALRLEYIDQLLERHVLVRVRVQRVAAHLVDQLQEAGAVIDLGAQHQRVDEEADQPFRLRAVAVGDRRADADVVLSGVTRQQHIEGCRQRHEQGALHTAAQVIEASRSGGRQCERLRRAAMALMGRTRTVCRQRQQSRCARQVTMPVIELLLQHVSAEPLALPVCEVGVLDRQFRQRRWLLLHVGAVQRGHLVHKNADGPAVGDNVMHRQQHDVLRVAQTQQARADQWAGGQVERCLRLVLYQPLRLGIALRMRQVRQIGRLQHQLQCRCDHLHRRAVHAGKAGTQGFVAAHDLVQRALQRRHVELSVQADRRRNIVERAARLELVEEPQALLRERQRHTLFALNRCQGRYGQTALCRFHARQQAGDRRRFEHRAQRQFDFECATDLRHQLRRQQRMAAQCEEVVVHAHFVEPEHTGPDAGHDLLGRRTWRHVALLAARHVRRGQGFAIHFAVRRQRHLLQHHEVGRHHVFG
ncbi:hypothetical protein DUGA6_62640 [Duganella sp. HH105]|nr:hypothetical protein DUGA6_62640 [Duganella sp. HH105]